jgi:hypothetical protein
LSSQWASSAISRIGARAALSARTSSTPERRPEERRRRIVSRAERRLHGWWKLADVKRHVGVFDQVRSHVFLDKPAQRPR